MKSCLSCGEPIKSPKKYCNNKCQGDFYYKEYIKRWKLNLEDGMRGKYQLSNYIKRYLFEKFDSKCAICGWNKVNPFTGNIPLEIEHIDGNYKNNTELNLTLICPNCHSLTATYKGANLGSGRKERKGLS